MEMTVQRFSQRVGVSARETVSKYGVQSSLKEAFQHSNGSFFCMCVDWLNKGKWALAVQIRQIGFSLARWVQCVWSFSLQQYAYTWGMSIPFVDPWERSSISLLGTALMRPGILPFIPHSLQLGTAHSFRYGHSGVFVYTDTMQWAKAAHSPLKRLCTSHPLYTWKTALFRISCAVRQQQSLDVVFLCASSSSKESSAREYRGRSYGHDLQI